MATQGPSKKEFLEALNKKGITTVEELVDAIMPETGGYEYETSGDQSGLEGPLAAATALDSFFKFGFGSALDVGQRAPRGQTPL